MTREDFLFLLGDKPETDEAFVDGNMFAGGGFPKGCLAWFDLSDGTWTDLKTGLYTLSHSGVSVSDAGGTFAGSSAYIGIPQALMYANKVYEIVCGSMTMTGGSPVLASVDNGGFSGLEYDSGWKVWQDGGYTPMIAGASSKNFFADKNIKIAVQANKKWHVYVNDVLVLSTTNAVTDRTPANGFRIGHSSGRSIHTSVIKRLAVYDNEVLGL